MIASKNVDPLNSDNECLTVKIEKIIKLKPLKYVH